MSREEQQKLSETCIGIDNRHEREKEKVLADMQLIDYAIEKKLKGNLEELSKTKGLAR